MKRFVAGAVMAASLSTCVPAAAAPNPVMAPIVAAMKASNAGDRAGLIALFTPDATVVDNFAPYRFTPPNGVGTWYDGFGADAAASHSTDGIITIKAPRYLHVHGDRAWAVVPTAYRYKLKGTPELETGALVFTLSRIGGSWKITTMSWAEASDSGLP
jgi:ketosteroid isomerase-like protein